MSLCVVERVSLIFSQVNTVGLQCVVLVSVCRQMLVEVPGPRNLVFDVFLHSRVAFHPQIPKVHHVSFVLWTRGIVIEKSLLGVVMLGQCHL